METLYSFVYSCPKIHYLFDAPPQIGCYSTFAWTCSTARNGNGRKKRERKKKRTQHANTHTQRTRIKWLQLNVSGTKVEHKSTETFYRKFGCLGILERLYFIQKAPLRLSKSLASFPTNQTRQKHMIQDPIVSFHLSFSAIGTRGFTHSAQTREHFDEIHQLFCLFNVNTATKESHTEFVDEFSLFFPSPIHSLPFWRSEWFCLGRISHRSDFNDFWFGQQQIICLLRNIAYENQSILNRQKCALDQIDNNEKWHSVHDTRLSVVHSFHFTVTLLPAPPPPSRTTTKNRL